MLDTPESIADPPANPPRPTHAVQASYLNAVHEPGRLLRVVSGLAVALDVAARGGRPFTALAFRGASGASVGYPLACFHGWPIVAIDKPGANAHRSQHAGAVGFERYAIVDDQVSSGATVQAIIEGVREHRHNKRWCWGVDAPVPILTDIFLYDTSSCQDFGEWYNMSEAMRAELAATGVRVHCLGLTR